MPSTTRCTSPPRTTWPRCSPTSPTSRPGLLVVDSVQTISSDNVDSGAGGVPQIRAVAAALIGAAKERGMATVLVGHVTKDGAIAGPRVLEHLVDVVLHFEGDRHSALRLVRATKNRYGAVDEVGCFEMREDGIVGLSDPSGLFLSDRDGRRPRHLRDRDRRGPPPAGHRGPGAGDPGDARRDAAAGGERPRLRARRDAGRRADAARQARSRRPGGVRRDRRRHRRARTGGGPRHRAGPRVGGARGRHPGDGLRDRRGVAVRATCGGCLPSLAASPRPPGSASEPRWCRPPIATTWSRTRRGSA